MLQKRLPVEASYRNDILIYGRDNLYPQMVEELVGRSPIAKSSILVTADFINGDGFELNGSVKLGEYTADELLNISSVDFAHFNSLALILDVNMEGDIVEVNPLEFKYVRLGIPDKNFNIRNVKVYGDWEEETPSGLKKKVLTFPLWEGKESAKQLISMWDVESKGVFPGFVYYNTPKKDQYPLCSLDSVLDSCQTNSEIQIFELAGVQNGFLGATLLKHYGKLSDPDRIKYEQMVDDAKGAENANSVLIWEVPEGTDKEVLEQFPANNQDALFNTTNRNTVNRITQTLSVPPSLIGIMPEGSFFSMQEINDAYDYFNVRTENRRNIIARMFNEIGKDFITPLQFGSIKKQLFSDAKIQVQ